MSTLTQQLEQLNKQQKELEERIRKQQENKEKLNNEASIDRLESLVKLLTEYLDYEIPGIRSEGGPQYPPASSCRKQLQFKYEQELNYYYLKLQRKSERDYNIPNIPRKASALENEEIFVTLIDILKKQDERIKKLENK